MANFSDTVEQLCEGVNALMVTPPPTPVPTTPPARRRKQSVTQLSQSPSSRPRLRQGIRDQIIGKKLFGKHTKNQPPVWSKEEESRLIEFMLIFTEGKSWVMHKYTPFWNEAGKHIQRCLKTFHRRSGNACRKRVINLSSKFESPLQADQSCNSEEAIVTFEDKSSSSASHSMPVSPKSSDPLVVIGKCKENLRSLKQTEQLEALSQLFSDFGQVVIPPDFLELTRNAVCNLKEEGRANLVYKLARCLGTKREDGSDTLLPVKRMPTGLIEYTVSFFNAENLQKVQCPADYRLWQQTMYTLFGMKWVKIHAGPMWSEDTVSQGSTLGHSKAQNPTKARVNIPGLSDRTLRRDIVSSGYTMGSEIQANALDQAAAMFPTDTQWWIKGDAVDIVPGLGDSVRGEWSGDVDLNDGKLQLMFSEYQERLDKIKHFGMGTKTEIEAGIVHENHKMEDTLAFLTAKLVEANADYENKLKNAKKSDKTMFEAAWKVEELDRVCIECRSIRTELTVVLDGLRESESTVQQLNIPRRLTAIRQTLSAIVKALYRWKRTAASHVFVFMISSELRNKKPYALPVQCVPCVGLKENDIRQLTNKLIAEMVKRKMEVVGSVSNGEFNYMRYKGYTRPLSVFKIRADVRSRYSRMSEHAMMDMLTPIRFPDGTVHAKRDNPAVSVMLLNEIWNWKQLGASTEDVISRLRPRTVPSGYTFNTWISGKSESMPDMLRSILSQLQYTYLVHKWDREGIPFKQHVYVPEVHPLTGKTYHEREDEPHVLKRMATSTREGGPDNVHVERYVEALSCPSARLTYSALSGARKQSVQDAERMFSVDMVEFMKDKGYDIEATYISAVGNWRRSCDERGLSQLQRCRYNHQLLMFVMDDLMPWHKTDYDLSLMEVNRNVSNVCGFTRQTLIAVTTNIESREKRRMDNLQMGIPPEHPRASTSDDVECFFSVMRDNLGKNFTLKEVKYNFRKVCMEFEKRINPDLPYFYHTSYHTRFAEGELPSFDKPSTREKRVQRVPQREQTASFVPGRATLPVRGSLSIRPQFHNKPLDLPPPPSAPVHICEHSYSQL